MIFIKEVGDTLKKRLALVLAAGLCLTSLASCGTGNTTDDTAIIIEPTSSTKNIAFSDDLIESLGDYGEEFRNYLSGEDFADTDSDTDNGLSFALTKEQRKAIINTLTEEASKVVASYKELGNRYAMNYSFDDGYLAVYCDAEDTENVQELVEKMIGLMACAESVNDNANDWSVMFTLNDAQTGETTFSQEVTADTPLVWQ